MQQKTLRRIDGIYHSALTVVIKTWKNSPWRRPVLIIAALLTLFTSSIYFYETSQRASALVQPNGRLLYGDATNLGVIKLRNNTYDYSFAAEVNTSPTSTSSHINYIVAKSARTRDEIIVGHQKADGRLDIVRGTNGYDVAGDYAAAWNAVTSNASTCTGTTPVDCTRTFDIAYERLGGRAMVVYAGDTSDAGVVPDSGKLYYCYFDGTSWGPQSNCAPTNGTNDITLNNNGRPTFVELKGRTGTNEIALVTSVDVAGTHEAEAWIWSGSAWGNSVSLTDTNNLVATSLEKGNSVTIEWERSANIAIAAFGTDAAQEVRYKKWDGASWSADTGGWDTNTNGADILGMNAESASIYDRIAIGVNGSSNDFSIAVWKNDTATEGFTSYLIDSTLENQTTGPPYTDLAWQFIPNSATESIIGFAQNAGNTADPEFVRIDCTSATCINNGVDSSMNTSGLTDDGTFTRLISSENSADMMALYGDIDRGLTAQHLTGLNWEATSVGLLEADVSGAGADTTIFHNNPATFVYIPYLAWQRNWRFFDDETVNDPSTGLNGAAENTAPTGVDAEEFIRLRMNINNPQAQGQADARKKLQFASGASCTPNTVENDPDCTWTDVGDTSETTAEWRYATSGETCANCSDNTAITTARLTGTTQNGTYTSDKDLAGGTNMDHNANAILELDYPLKAEAVSGGTTYYFRVYDVDQDRPVRREQDNDGANDCATATCTYPSLTTTASSITGTVYMADGTTPATTGNGGPCDGSTAVVSIRSNGGTADTGTCSNTDGTFTITQSNVSLTAGTEIAAYLTSTMKANTVTLAGGGGITGLSLYENRVTVRHENAGPMNVLGMDSYDSDQNDTDMLYDADDLATDTLVVESGNVLRVETGETFNHSTAIITTPKLHLKGTFTGINELKLTGTGTGADRPLLKDGGSFTNQTVTEYNGNGNLEVEAGVTYAQLELFPTSGSPTYILGTGASQTLTLENLFIGTGSSAVTVDADTYDPIISASGITRLCGVTCTTGITYLKSSNNYIMRTSGTSTWQDYNSTPQDIGNVVMENGTSTPLMQLITSVKCTSLSVAASHTLDVNGSNTITLTGTTGTLFTINGTFTESTGTVLFNGDGSPTLTANNAESNTFNQVQILTAITADRTYTFGTSTLTANNDFFINATSNSTANLLTVNLGGNLTLPNTRTLYVYNQVPASPASVTLDTTASNHSISTGKISIQAEGNIIANNSSITLTGTSGTLFTRSGNGIFTAGGSTVTANGNATLTLTSGSFSGSNAFNNLTLSPALSGGAKTYSLGSSALEINGNFNITPTAGAVSQSLAVNMGNSVTVASTKTTTINADDTNSPTVTLDTRPSTTDYNLTTGFLVVGDATGGADTLDAGGSSSVITITGTSGTLFTNLGTFTQGTSEVVISSASGTPTFLNGATTFHKLTINSTATVVNAGAAITFNNTAGNKFYIQNGVFNQENHTITPGTSGELQIGATGTLCLGGSTEATVATCNDTATQTTAQTMPAFTTFTLDAASTVRYLSDAATTVSRIGGANYGNLVLAPKFDSSDRTYTFESGTVAINGNFDIVPSDGTVGANSLTVNLAGNITVASGKTTTINASSTFSPTATLDLMPSATPYDLSTGLLVLGSGAGGTNTLDASGSTSVDITLTGTSGTLFTRYADGSFTHGTSTVIMNPNASVTLTSDDNSITFYNLSLTPTLASSSKTYTFGNQVNTVSNNFTITPSAGSALGLTVNMGADLDVTGTTTITPNPTNSPTATLDMRPASTDYKLTSGHLVIGSNGTLDGSSTTAAGLVTLNGASGTLWTQSGSFTITSATSEVIFNPTASVTLTSNNSLTFYKLSVLGNVSANSTYTLGTQSLTINNDLIINPQNTDFTSTVLINMGADIIVNGNTELGGTGLSPADTTLDTRPSSTDFNLTTNNLTIDGGILDAGSSASSITIKGNYDNGGTFTAGSSTINFGDSSGTKTLTGSMTSTNAFNNVVFNGSGDTWNVNAAMTANGNYTMTAGTVVQGANIDITLFGDVLLSSGVTFTKASGSGKFIMDGDATTETFTDSTSPLQDLGAVQIGLSPGVTNLSSDMSATSLTIPTGDRLNTRGWEVTLSTFFDAQGTAILDTTDNGAAGREGDGTTITVGTNWTFSGTGTFTLDTDAGTPTKNLFNGTADQTITTGGKTFYQFEINNTGAGGSDDIIISGALDINGTFTITDGDLDTNTNDTNTNVAHDFTIGTNGSIDAGTGTWTFDPTGTKTWTDNSSGKWSPGLVTIGSGASTPQINLGSSVEVSTLTISGSHTLALQSSGYTLDIIGTGAASTVLTVSGTLSPGTSSTVKYSATNSGGTVIVTATTYKHLQLSGSETYDLGNNLTSTNALAGNLTIDSGATLDAVSGSNYNIELAGNYSNSGTFTARNGTITLNGSTAQTLSGTMTSSSAFYNLTITNNSGSSASDNERTGFVASVDFNAAADITNNYTITTANVRVEFENGAEYNVTNINWNGQASGTRIYFRNSLTSGTWLLNQTGTQTDVSYVNVSRSDAGSGGANTINASNGTNFDAGNNQNWTFTASISISGTCDQFDQTTDCTDDGANQIAVAINGSLQGQVDTVVDGSWQINSVTAPANGDIITVFIDGESTDNEEAVAVAKYDGTGSISGIVLFHRHLTIGSGDNQTLSNADIDAYDNSVSSDEDIFFDVSAGDDLTVDSLTSYTDEELYIVASNTYRPASGGGADVNTTHLENDGTITADSNAINVFGSWQNDSTFTAGSSTVTFTSTTTGRTLSGTLTGNSGKFNNLIFDGVSGAWSYSAAVEVGNDFTVTNGAVTASNNNLTVTRDFTLANTSGVSYTAGSSTVTVSRHYTDLGGKYVIDTSKVDMAGTGTMDVANSFEFYNLDLAHSSATTTLPSSKTIIIKNVATLYGGTMTGASTTFSLRPTASSKPLVFNSATTLNGTGFNIITFSGFNAGTTVTVDGDNYGNWNIFFGASTNNTTYNLDAALTHTGEIRVYAGASTGTTFNTADFDLTTPSFRLGSGGATQTVSANFGSSNVTFTGTSNTLHPESTGGSYNLNLGSSNIDTKGNILFVNSSGTISVTPGTSTITWTHTSGTKTYAPSSQSLHNLVLNGSGGTVQPTGAVDVNNNFTITAGTYDTVSGSNYALTIGGNYSNSDTFTAQQGTVTFDATDTGNTIQGTLSGGSAFYNLAFNGSGGEWTPNAAVAVTNDLTMTAGTLLGTQNVTVNSNVAGTAGIINLTGGTFEQRPNNAGKNFGTTSGSAAWTFNDLTFSDSCTGACVAGNITITTQTGGTGGINVAGILRVSKSGDQEGVDLSAGNRTWTLSGTGGDPFQVIASPAGDLVPNTSTFSFTGNNGGGNTTIQTETYYNLVVNNGAETYNLEGTTVAQNVTVTAGTLALNGQALTVSADLTVDGTLSGATDVTVLGDAVGTGTINLSGGTFLMTEGISSNFGTTSGTNAWTFNNLTFREGADLGGSTYNTQTGGTGGINISSILIVGDASDGTGTTLNAGNRTWTLSGTGGDPFQLIGPAPIFTASTSTFAFTGNNGAGNTTVQSATYNILQVNNGSETYTLEGNTSSLDTTISAGTLSLNGFTLSCTNDLTVNGTLSGASNVTVNGSATGSGTVTLTGGTFEQRVAAAETFGASSGSNTWRFATLIFSNSSGTDRTISLNAGTGILRVDTVLQIGKATDTNVTTFDNNTANDREIAATGSVNITSKGTLLASNTQPFTVSNDWTNAGTFTHNSGTVTFDTTTTATFAGATTFYNFTSTAAGKTLEFTAGQTFTIASGGLLTLTGTADPNEIQIKSTSAGNQWFINHQGTESVSYVQVIDSGCDVASTDITTSNSVNDGNNGTCWKFNSVFSQEDYRFGQPNGVNIDYTGAPAENTAYSTAATGDDFRLRMLIHVADTELSASGKNFKLQFGEKTAANCSAGVSWNDVQAGSGVIRYYDGAGRTDGDNLTTNGGDPSAGHTVVAQDYEEANNFTNSVAAIPAGQDGLWDFSLINDSAVGGKRYCFRAVEADGTVFANGYAQYPEVIVDEELVFSLDATSKNFGVIQPGDNPTDQTSTVTVTTNATTGYVVYAWTTQAMTKGAHTISDWSGTNASPTTFGNGSFGFGYSTDDSSLTGGTADRFTNGGAKYAGFTHSGPGDPVADRTSGPVSNQQNVITYRLAGGVGQQAGTYTTVVVYVVSTTF